MPSKPEDPILTVKLQKGLADRKRLPLGHVLAVLDELRQLITAIGKEMQRDSGVLHPTGDFGLELVANLEDAVFQPSSVRADIAVTQDVRIGVLATQQVVKTVGLLDNDDFPGLRTGETIDPRIIRHLNRIAKIQKSDRTELHLAFQLPDYERPMAARFGQAGMSAVRSLLAAAFTVEGATLYGKLYELSDHDPSDEDQAGRFWGELRRENGDVWRLEFRSGDVGQVAPMFRKQVVVTGNAVYFRVFTPKLVVEQIALDRDRDYVAAFDELFGTDRELYRTDLDTLLRQMRGDD
ncbi:MAG: hypothetical protein ACLQGV_10995 [Bryobacteraceae bacterium]